MKTTLAFRRQEWRRMHWTLPLGATLSLCPIQVHPATDPPETPPSALIRVEEEADEVVELSPLTVTGTRIRGIDLETTLPVQRLTITDLEATGFSRFDDALRSLPMAMAPSGDGTYDAPAWAPGISTVNLRGFLPEMTLVLVDGLRMVVNDGGGGPQTPVDLNAIPSAAIESVEILRDGASAVYGADAIIAVMNFRTIRDLEGTRIHFGLGQAEGTGSGEIQGSLIHGQALSNRAKLILTLEYYERNHLRAREHGFMTSSDFRERGGRNLSSSRSYPAKFAVHDSSQPLFGQWVTYPEPTLAPTLAGLVTTPLNHPFADGNYYDENSEIDFLGDRQSFGAYMHLAVTFGPRWEGFLDVFYQRSWNRSADSASPFDLSPDDTVGSAVIPIENPFNPYGLSRTDGGEPMPLLSMRGRVVEAGRRMTEIATRVPRVVLGVRGSIFADWDWQLAGVWAESKSWRNRMGHLRWDRLNEAMSGVDLDGDGLVEREEYFNPFGPNTEKLIDHLRARDFRFGGESKLWMLDGHASGGIWKNDAFAISGALGGEIREEQLDSNFGPLINAGLIVDLAGAEGPSGDRETMAAYGEVRTDYRDKLTLHLAGRFEHYSDFGQTSAPKVSTSWRVLPEVMVRTSYGEGFLAPSLTRLHQAPWEFFAENAFSDPKRPGDPLSYGYWAVFGGNPKLAPAQSTNRNYGLIFEPLARLGTRDGWWKQTAGLTLGIEYAVTDLTDGFKAPGTNWLLQHEDELAERFPGQGIVIERAPLEADSPYAVGRVTRAVNRIANLESIKFRQYDLWLQWPISLGSWGDLNLRCDALVAESRKEEEIEYEGTYLRPRLRLTAQVGWSRGDWSTQWWFQYIGGVPSANEFVSPVIWDLPTADASFRINAQVSYTGFQCTRVIVGARNLLNRDPPFDAYSRFGYHSQHPSEKRFWYLRVEQQF